MISIYGLIGAFIGLLLLKSFWGAMLGYFVGSVIESASRGQQQAGSRTHRAYGDAQGFSGGSMGGRPSQGQFSRALLILSAEVMRADGSVLKAELDYVKQFFTHQFPREAAAQYILQLKSILSQQHNITQICSELNQYMPLQQRTVLVQYLFGIAQADGNVSKVELSVIERIAIMLKIPISEFEQLKSMFWKDASNSYRILGVDPSATNEEIKKAYRKMAVAHHPDKYAQMGEEHQKAANEKFQKIQDAYETIKKDRDF
jgi:DnaJ like chaperone protein